MLSNGLDLTFWNKINMVFYNIIPFGIMIIFNTLLIVNLRRMTKKRPEEYKSGPKKRSPRRQNLTISLLILTFIFLIMTLPSSLFFGFFYYGKVKNMDRSVAFLIDDISFLNNSMLFFISFVSNRNFRNAIFDFFQPLRVKKLKLLSSTRSGSV